MVCRSAFSLRKVSPFYVGSTRTFTYTTTHLRHSSKPTLAINACPFAGGQRHQGVALGPQALLNSGLETLARNRGYHVPLRSPTLPLGVEVPALSTPPSYDLNIGNLISPRYVGTAMKALSDHIYSTMQDSDLVLNLGGDHSIGLATVHATLRKFPDAIVIWVDAHADINTPETTTTGNLHGCPLSFLLGFPGTNLPSFEWVNSPLTPSQLIYIGLRSVDPPEAAIIEKLGITSFTSNDVQTLGVEKMLKRVMKVADPEGKKKIHLSFDIDALDPKVAPSTGTRVPDGMSLQHALDLVSTIAGTRRLVAVDLVELNPLIGNELAVGETVSVARDLLANALGGNK